MQYSPVQALGRTEADNLSEIWEACCPTIEFELKYIIFHTAIIIDRSSIILLDILTLQLKKQKGME